MVNRKAEDFLKRYRNFFFIVVDDIILFFVAIGILAAAIVLLVEAASDILLISSHSIAHIISDLMFVLIIVELFRQVVRQINRQPFSMTPFLFIGVVASIRGLLLAQLKLAMGEVEWVEGMGRSVLYAVIVLILIISHVAYYRGSKRPDEETSAARKDAEDQ